MNDNLTEAFKVIRNHILDRGRDYCDRWSIPIPWELSLKNMEGTIWANDDIIITPGHPPTVIVTDAFILEYLLGRKSAPFFNRRIEWAMDKLHLMDRTLRHPIPLHTAIALRNDAKKWAKTLVPQLVTKIANEYLEYSYSITVKDKITGTSLTLHGNDPHEIKEQGTIRLSKMIFEREDLEEFHDVLMAIKNKAEQKPSSLSVGGVEGEKRENFRYD